MMKKLDALNQVAEFHKTFDHPILDQPTIPAKKRCDLRVSLIQEELNELKEKHKGLEDQHSSLEKELRVQKDKNKKLNTEIYDIQKKLAVLEEELKLCQEKNKREVKKLSKNEETIERIKAKSSDIDFNRIGIASMDQKDDLKIIKGIGKFIEEKLNALGIYQFKQIANFNSEDEELVNKAIEFFPGRVKRDDWKGQAKSLLK